MSDDGLTLETRPLKQQPFYKVVLPELAAREAQPSSCASGLHGDPVITSSMTTFTPSYLSDGSFGVCYLYSTVEHAVNTIMAAIEPMLMIGAPQLRDIPFSVVSFEVSGDVLDCFNRQGEELFDWDTDIQTLGRMMLDEGAQGVLFPDPCGFDRSPALCVFDPWTTRRMNDHRSVRVHWDGSGFNGYAFD